MIRVGVIGAGSMGEHHVRNYKTLNVELVGVAEPFEARREEIEEKYDVQCFSDYHDLLKEGLDAVNIVVPTTLHKTVALDCIEHGVDILLEKPIADTIENATDIISASKRAGIRLTIGHIERFNPMVGQLKKVIEDGSLGRIVSIHALRVGPHNPRIRDVGIINDLSIHDIDIMNYLYDQVPLSVSAVGGIVTHPKEDYASIQLRYSEERSGHVETNWLTPQKIRKLNVIATRGVAFGNYIDKSLEWHYDDHIKRYSDTEEPLARELKCFIEGIKHGTEFVVTPQQALDALRVVKAAERSYKSRREVDVT